MRRRRLLSGEREVEGSFARPDEPFRIRANVVGHWRYSTEAEMVGWRPGCEHHRAPVPCMVLDPFAGSGTTLAVAKRLARRSIGIELQADYLRLIRRRLERVAWQPQLFDVALAPDPVPPPEEGAA
ncbi:MAG: site-specific DNA-methyltransferase [Candidatus Dormibacteraeota bacterium]|nr:site-specific DNA-methyltransferase [Candidatus Dormibacteraeota bacterium]